MIQKNISQKITISKIQKEQIYSNEVFESLIVSVEEGLNVPIQPAPANAVLYLVSGKIEFEIDGKFTMIEPDDLFTFSKGQMHGLKALADSKFLISRTIE